MAAESIGATLVYEVNVDVHPDRASDYEAFIRPHVRDMYVALQGITQVTVAKRDMPCADNGWTGYTVTYHVRRREDLDDYLTHRAPALRQPMVLQFGDQARASRRVMAVVSLQESQPPVNSVLGECTSGAA